MTEVIAPLTVGALTAKLLRYPPDRLVFVESSSRPLERPTLELCPVVLEEREGPLLSAVIGGPEPRRVVAQLVDADVPEAKLVLVLR